VSITQSPQIDDRHDMTTLLS